MSGGTIMPKRAALGVTICLVSSLLSPAVRAQNRASADASVNAMRGLPSISQNDQQRIRDWVGLVVGELAAAKADVQNQASATFRQTISSQATNPGNGQAFRSQFASETAKVAATHFADASAAPIVVVSLARALLDMNAIESVPGLMAGLACKVDAARYLSARAIILQQRAIAADSAQFPLVIQALQIAGAAETSPIVSSRIYRALAFSGQATAVLDAYLAIFDTRLGKRRTSNTNDGAETEALLYFSDPATLGSLNQVQKTQLVARVAILLRLDADRYNNALLEFVEIDNLERSLVEAETILNGATKVTNGGDITNLLNSQGRTAKDLIPAEAAKWVGDATATSQGALNATPWSVPVGAP